MTNRKPIGAYKAINRTGWAACDKDGHTWPVDPDEAEELETARLARLKAAGKTPLQAEGQ